MPSDKLIFFKSGDFEHAHYLSMGEKVVLIKDAAMVSNTKIAPLLQAMEIMREALKYYETKEYDSNRYGDCQLQFTAEEALEKCDEILK